MPRWIKIGLVTSTASVLLAAGLFYYLVRSQFVAENSLGPQAMEVLEKGEHFYLLSLEPSPRKYYEVTKTNLPKGDDFHEYTALRKTEITSREERAALLKALHNGISSSDGAVAACFNPRHGIHAILGEKTVDLVICFECLQIRVYGGVRATVTTTRSPEVTFDKFLKPQSQ